METLFQGKEAFGYPGIAPKWTRTDGETFFHEEKRDLTTQLGYLDRDSLGYRITKIDPQER